MKKLNISLITLLTALVFLLGLQLAKINRQNKILRDHIMKNDLKVERLEAKIDVLTKLLER